MARLDWTTFIIIFHYYYLSLSFVTIITTLPFAEAGLDDSKKRIFKALKRKSFFIYFVFLFFQSWRVCSSPWNILLLYCTNLEILGFESWKFGVEASSLPVVGGFILLFKILDNCDMFVSFYISMVEIQAPETCLIFWISVMKCFVCFGNLVIVSLQ